MGFKRYFVANGEVLGQELLSGTDRRDFLTDALGSVTGTVDQTGAVKNTYRYKPYGQPQSTTGSDIQPDFKWVGSKQYRWCGGNDNSDYYVRARHYNSFQGRWNSVDALWPGQLPYAYARNAPVLTIDPSGMQPFCADPGACPGGGSGGGTGGGGGVTTPIYQNPYGGLPPPIPGIQHSSDPNCRGLELFGEPENVLQWCGKDELCRWLEQLNALGLLPNDLTNEYLAACPGLATGAPSGGAPQFLSPIIDWIHHWPVAHKAKEPPVPTCADLGTSLWAQCAAGLCNMYSAYGKFSAVNSIIKNADPADYQEWVKLLTAPGLPGPKDGNKCCTQAGKWHSSGDVGPFGVFKKAKTDPKSIGAGAVLGKVCDQYEKYLKIHPPWDFCRRQFGKTEECSQCCEGLWPWNTPNSEVVDLNSKCRGACGWKL